MHLPHFWSGKVAGLIRRVTFLLLWLGTLCSAETAAVPSLTWDQSTVELKAPLDAAPNTKLEARFPFKNTADHIIEVVTVQSDCGCTVPELKPRRYTPGQIGVLTALYPVGDKVGREEKHLAICTSDAPDKPTILTVIMDVPKLLDLNPAALVWKTGDSPVAKIVAINGMDGIVIKRLTVSTSQMLFAPALHLTKVGTQYELEVTPTRTDLVCTGQIILSGDFEVVTNKEGGKSQNISKVILLHVDINP